MYKPRFPVLELEPVLWRPVFPNAYTAEELTNRRVRNYLVVVSTRDNQVQRVIQGPYEDGVDENLLDRALKMEFAELNKQYRPPEYDIVIGRGELYNLKIDLPTVQGWEDVQTEDLIL